MQRRIAYKLSRSLDRCLYGRDRLGPTRRRCLVYGNCQAWPVALLLASNQQFRRQYSIVKLPPVHDLQPGDEPRLLAAVRQVDLLIYQPTQDNYRGMPWLGSTFLAQQTKPGCVQISFPSLYFRGYSPEVLYLRRPDGQLYDGPASQYHHAQILDQYLAGQPVAGTVARLLNPELIPAEQSLAVVADSLAELRRRESELTIPISGFLEQNFRRRRLFLTVNHPALALLQYVTQGILAHLGFADLRESRFRTVQDRLGYEPLGPSYFSIHPATYRNLGLSFPNPPRFLCILRRWDLPTAVTQFYRHYDQHPEIPEAYRQKRVD